MSERPADSATIPAKPTPLQPTTWAWLAALIAWTLLLGGFALHGGAAFEPVDAWVAQTAREMYENVQTEGWRGFIVPEFSGEVRLQKSPGAYWAVMLVAWLRGGVLDELTVRVPSLFGGLMLVLSIFWLTRRIADDRAAIFAGFATASSGMLLFWAGRGSADLPMAALMTLALTCLWIGLEHEPPGRKRWLLVLAGYFCAGLAMLYKMPMPLVCVWLPALAYVLLCNRWRLLASPWHLLGALLFFLPWAPWFLAVIQVEPIAIAKWRVEFFDRVTGELPNVQGQDAWPWYFFYLGAAAVYAAPYMLSLPLALWRGLRPDPAVQRRGQWFLLIWAGSLLLFFTLAVGKEMRYFLPAMPPLFCLLGIELSHFFSPRRTHNPHIDRLAFWAVTLLVPAGMGAAVYVLYKKVYLPAEMATFVEFSRLWPPAVIAGAVFSAGCTASAWLYCARREHASFAALAGSMWALYAIAWACVMPYLVSAQPFKELAVELQRLTPEQQAALRQVANQDSRLIWYSDIRYPRHVDQLELLEIQGGKRDLQREIEIWGERMTDALDGQNLVLFVSAPLDYYMYMTQAPARLAELGRPFPKTHVWLSARTGHPKQRFLVFGNQPPPWPEPPVPLNEKLMNNIRAALDAAAATRAARSEPEGDDHAAPAAAAQSPASAPAQPGDTPAPQSPPPSNGDGG